MSFPMRENPAVWALGMTSLCSLGMLAIYLYQNPGAWDEIFGDVLNNDDQSKSETGKENSGVFYPSQRRTFVEDYFGICPVTKASHIVDRPFGKERGNVCVACGEVLWDR